MTQTTHSLRYWQCEAGPSVPVAAIVKDESDYGCISVIVGHLEVFIEVDADRGLVVRVWPDTRQGVDPEVERAFRLSEILKTGD